MSNENVPDAASLTEQELLDAEASIEAEQESIDRQASIDAADLQMFRTMQALQKTPTSAVEAPTKPIRGGVQGKHAWTGGSTVNPRTSPATPDCYRDHKDIKLMRQTYSSCTAGLPESKRLEVGTGAAGATGGNTNMVAWLNEVRRFLQDTGQDGVFYIKDKDGMERSLLTSSGLFTNNDAEALAKSFTVDGDAYDVRNMETSGAALMNSIGSNLHADLQKFITGDLCGPIVFMLIVNRVQASSASVWRKVVDKLKKLRLCEEPGENVDTFCDKITGYCRSLEGADKLPEDITSILAEAFCTSTIELFRIKFVTIFDNCDENPRFMTWEQIVQTATSSYRSLQGRDQWTVDVPRGGALGMAGGLIPGDGPRVCYICGSQDHFQRSCPNAGEQGGRGGQISTWKSSPPATGASEFMRKFETDYFWCTTCKSWNLTHKTIAHKKGIGRRGPVSGAGAGTPVSGAVSGTGTANGAPASGAGPPTEAAGMIAPANPFSLIQFGGFACTPAGDWYSVEENDKTELKD